MSEIIHRNEDGKKHCLTGPAVIRENGNTQYWVNGRLHRDDGPAVEDHIKKYYAWHKHGSFHRIGGPAIMYKNGSEEWFVSGDRHRLGGPAIIHMDNNTVTKEEWYKNGKMHRIGGPAYSDIKGKMEWYKDGKLHRLDGPARIYDNFKPNPNSNEGRKEWWIDGKQYEYDEWKEITSEYLVHLWKDYNTIPDEYIHNDRWNRKGSMFIY